MAGKDRTGLVAAVLLALADVEADAIAARLRGHLRRTCATATSSATPMTDPARILEVLRCPEEGAHNMLSFLARAGGVRAYLAQIGLTETEMRQLRARLRG